MLSTGAGAPVPDDELIEQVWGDRRPGNVTQALRTIVSRLRVGLGPVGQQYLHRHHHGYALAIPALLTDHGLLAALTVRAAAPRRQRPRRRGRRPRIRGRVVAR